MHPTNRTIGKVTACTLLYILLGLLALSFLFPFLWMLLSSLKAQNELVTWPPTLFPKVPRFDNYVKVLTQIKIPNMFMNSLIVSVTVTLGQVFFCALAGYSFGKLRFPGREALFKIYLATMMVPGMVTLIPMYVIFSRLQWVNSYQALILPGFFGSAFGVFLMRQFFMTLPSQLGEAAFIDGAGHMGIFFRIYLPLIQPVLATLTILSFMNTWNDFLWPLIVVQSERMKTLTVGLAAFQGNYGSQFNLLMAGAVVSIVPVLIVFFAAQKYFIEGIAMTGMKA